MKTDGPEVGKVKGSNAGLTEDRGHGGGNLLEEGLDIKKDRDVSMETKVSLFLLTQFAIPYDPLSFLCFRLKTVTMKTKSFDSTFKDLNTTVVGDTEQKLMGGLLEEGLDMKKVGDASMKTEVNKSLSLNSIFNSIWPPLSFLCSLMPFEFCSRHPSKRRDILGSLEGTLPLLMSLLAVISSHPTKCHPMVRVLLIMRLSMGLLVLALP